MDNETASHLPGFRFSYEPRGCRIGDSFVVSAPRNSSMGRKPRSLWRKATLHGVKLGSFTKHRSEKPEMLERSGTDFGELSRAAAIRGRRRTRQYVEITNREDG
jgi:hypothetical protein